MIAPVPVHCFSITFILPDAIDYGGEPDEHEETLEKYWDTDEDKWDDEDEGEHEESMEEDWDKDDHTWDDEDDGEQETTFQKKICFI